MSTDTLLQHLDRVRQTGQGRWMACCPAHGDKSPSLAIRETDDGRILLHCFGGCSVPEIVASVGLKMEDLFPAKESGENFKKGERRPFPATDVLRGLAAQTAFLYLCAKSISDGEQLCAEDLARLLVCCSQIAEAGRAAGLTI